jgi:TolB protein
LTTVQPPDAGAICCWVTYSPDGSRLLTGNGSSVDVMNADGTARREILHGGALGYPTWSPDGSRVAVAMAVEGYTQIFVVDIAGGAPQQLTTGLLSAFEPTWSHDGRRIALGGAKTSLTRQAIFVMAADGADLHQVGPDMPGGSTVADSGPMWSSDDHTIAFDVGSEPGTEPRSVIDMVAADGTGFRLLLPDGLQGSVPIWSPDGSWIAFAGWHPGARTADLYVVRPDGSGARRLATDVSLFDHPWSPDGTSIAFAHLASQPAGNSGTRYADLREIRLDGSDELVVAAHEESGTVIWPHAWP